MPYKLIYEKAIEINMLSKNDNRIYKNDSNVFKSLSLCIMKICEKRLDKKHIQLRSLLWLKNKKLEMIDLSSHPDKETEVNEICKRIIEIKDILKI